VKDLRDYLAELDANDHVVRVKKPVDIRHELAAVQWRIEQDYGKVVVFENVRDYPGPVVGNLFLLPYRMGICPTIPYGEDVLTFTQTIKKAGVVYPIWATNDLFMPLFREIETIVVNGLDNPMAPRVVPSRTGRQVNGDALDLLRVLPIPHYYREDAGHYITAGVMSAKDPETGVINSGIYRIQVLGPNQLVAMVNLKRDLFGILTKARRMNRPVDVAISIGAPPSLLVAATMSVPPDRSEYDVAGGIAGEPLDVRPGRTVDLLVPADSEIVIEGTIAPGERVTEGPFTEYDLLASQRSNGFPIRVNGIDLCEDAIFHSLVCPSREMLSIILCLGITEIRNARRFLERITPNVKDVWLLPGVSGVGLVVSVVKEHNAEPQEILHALFAYSARFKRIVVVDDDVDIYDPCDVQWAIDTRVAYERDVMVLSATGEYTDPARLGDFSVKMGIDATTKHQHPNRFVRSDTGQFDVNLARYLDLPGR
jgi:2,5-furandicarboxylate decarboxylase 1